MGLRNVGDVSWIQRRNSKLQCSISIVSVTPEIQCTTLPTRIWQLGLCKFSCIHLLSATITLFTTSTTPSTICDSGISVLCKSVVLVGNYKTFKLTNERCDGWIFNILQLFGSIWWSPFYEYCRPSNICRLFGPTLWWTWQSLIERDNDFSSSDIDVTEAKSMLTRWFSVTRNPFTKMSANRCLGMVISSPWDFKWDNAASKRF